MFAGNLNSKAMDKDKATTQNSKAISKAISKAATAWNSPVGDAYTDLERAIQQGEKSLENGHKRILDFVERIK